MSSTTTQPATAGSAAWCLGCNYPLQGLPDSRCPECGRTFDLGDHKSFNSSRPLTWLDRKLLAPIGVVTFTLVLIPCVWLLWMSLGTDIYDFGGYVLLIALTCGCVAVIVATRTALKRSLPPAGVPRAPDGTRIKAIVWIALLASAFVFFQVPLRVAFLFARPELDRIVAQLPSGTLAQPIGPRRAGPFIIQTSGAYGGPDMLFFRYTLLGRDGGLAYCPTVGPRGHYNAGNDGPLGWHWHWWIDD